MINYKHNFKNQISKAISYAREYFAYNKEWWLEKMGTGNNNEYFLVKYTNGDMEVIDSNWFFWNSKQSFPRINASNVAYVSRHYGEGVETITTPDMEINTDCITLYKDGKEVKRYEMNEDEMLEVRRIVWNSDDDEDVTLHLLDFARNLINSKVA